MGVALQQSGQESQIVLDGAVDITVAAELKDGLAQAISSAEAGRKIDVQVEAATALDVTAYQLLWSASREAARAGKALKPVGEFPEPVKTALAEMGLDAAALFQ